MSSTTRLAYSKLESDAELIDRASTSAGHRVYYACCGRGHASRVDELAESHGVKRRIVWVDS